MSSCPKCQKPVDAQALNCPHCNNPLKAFGHPGMPLYQSAAGTSLCDRCSYHLDDTCNFPKRPYATSCTLFRDTSIPIVATTDIPTSQLGIRGVKNWLYRNRRIITIAVLLLISVAVALNS
ncbi:MAG: zinc ribbon domain-containing protein [Cyanobacteria bacterium P01_C01_bin.72]